MASQYEDGKDGKFYEQNELNRLQIVQFESSRHPKPLVSFFSGVLHISRCLRCTRGTPQIFDFVMLRMPRVSRHRVEMAS